MKIDEQYEKIDETSVGERSYIRNVLLVNMILSCNRSIADFSRKSGYTRSHMSKLINGHMIPRKQDKLKIARTLSEQMKTPIDSLMLFEEDIANNGN